MGKPLKITIDDLQEVTNAIFDQLRSDLKSGEVVLGKDSYWEVGPDEMYDFSCAPDGTKLHVGQLYDDWDFLQKILNDKDQAVTPMFMHLAPILRYIAWHASARVGRNEGGFNS
jgi:hypothetical protein